MLQLESYRNISINFTKEFNSILNSFVPYFHKNDLKVENNLFKYNYLNNYGSSTTSLKRLNDTVVYSARIKVKGDSFTFRLNSLFNNDTQKIIGLVCFINPYKYYYDNILTNNLIYLINKDIKIKYSSLYKKLVEIYSKNNVLVLEVDDVEKQCFTNYIEPNFNSIQDSINYENQLLESFLTNLNSN